MPASRRETGTKSSSPIRCGPVVLAQPPGDSGRVIHRVLSAPLDQFTQVQIEIVGTPHHVRRILPDPIELTREAVEPADLTSHEGIPSATVHRALLDCQHTIMSDRLHEAATGETGRLGLVPRHQLSSLLDDLKRQPLGPGKQQRPGTRLLRLFRLGTKVGS
jgi:hypothetical protein